MTTNDPPYNQSSDSSGEEYDRANPEYTPNKDRKMKEWRDKKAKEKKAQDLIDTESAIDAQQRNLARYDPELAKYIREQDEIVSRKKHFDSGHTPVVPPTEV